MGNSNVNDKGGEKYKYIAMATVSVAFLFFGYLWGNRSKVGELTIGDKGVVIKLSERERIEALIDRILNSNTPSISKASISLEEQEDMKYQRAALVEHLATVLRRYNYKSDVGRKILSIAESSQNPFDWEYVDAEVRKDPTITAPIFYVCTNANDWRGKRLSVQVQRQRKKGFTDDGKEYFAVPIKNCTRTDQNVVWTGLQSLVDASNQPGSLAKARPVVTIPQ